MNKPVLVILAAGMGSRYGGLKQIDPIDEYGHLIIDFSIYDAIQAGFEEVVFIIKKEKEKDFRETIADRISQFVNVRFVYQETNNIPSGFKVPEGRVKPWGTGHAVLSCLGKINTPFAVINADDFYGKQAFPLIYNFLKNNNKKYHYSMVGYVLENTLSENGYVARGVCKVGDDGRLISIKERTRIEQRGNITAYSEDGGNSWIPIEKGSIVSMNLWGFTPDILEELDKRFGKFLEKNLTANPLKAEYMLPDVVGELIGENKANVHVLKSKDRWYGVTYREDKETVVKAFRKFKKQGLYPEKLWEKA